MISRWIRARTRLAWLRDAEHPEVVLLAVLLGGVTAYAWTAEPVGIAVVIAVEMALAGFGAVWLIGPVRARLGFARYGTLAAAAVAVTLFGRVLTGWAQVALLPVAILGLWAVLVLELRLNDGRAPRMGIELVMVGIVFTSAAGIGLILPPDTWPPPLLLLVLACGVPALRSAELRGRFGSEAVGQAALHLLAVAQVGAALLLLSLPGVVGAAMVALTFHAWAGAAEALDSGAPLRDVLLEFGSLALLGLAVAIVVPMLAPR